MKEVTKEKIQKYAMYEALDGTEFHDKAECQKYEESAKGVIRARIAKLIVGRGNEWELPIRVFQNKKSCLCMD